MGCGALFQTVAEANVSTELQSKMAATLKLLTQVRIIVASYLSVAFTQYILIHNDAANQQEC